jgi:ABC-type sulfate/molybdate transport systems ATPase subunit
MEHRALTVVFATREGEDALRWADRVAVLAQGRMAQVDVPLVVYRHPVCLDVAEAMGELNRIPATVSDGRLHVAGSLLSAEAGRLPEGRRVVMGVRPSALEVAVEETPFSRRLRATVGSVSRIGPVQRVLFGLGRQRGIGFCAEIAASHRIAVGDHIVWWVTAMRLYDPLTGAAL